MLKNVKVSIGIQCSISALVQAAVNLIRSQSADCIVHEYVLDDLVTLFAHSPDVGGNIGYSTIAQGFERAFIPSILLFPKSRQNNGEFP